MPQIQMPDIVPAGLHFERGMQGLQNAMLTRSRLKSADLEQQQMGMQNQEMQRELQKRTELESLLAATPEPDRERVGLEWAKVHNPDLYGKLAALQLQKLQQGLQVNPEQAAANFERATGEKLSFDPMRGLHLVDMPDGSKLAISARGVEHFKNAPPERGTVVPAGAGYIPPGAKEPSYSQPNRPEPSDKSITPFEEWQRQNPGKPVGEYFKLSQQARPVFGMPQFVGTQDGKALVFQPQRGGAGSMGTVELPGQGPVQPRTEPADIRNQRMAFGKAEPVLNSIAELSERINVNRGVVAKLIGGVEKAKAQANLNDDVAEYESLIAGFTPMVARAVGHVGVLTEQDVQSVRMMFPKPGDSKSLRDRKINRLKSIIAGVKDQIENVNSPAAPKADPLGLFK